MNPRRHPKHPQRVQNKPQAFMDPQGRIQIICSPHVIACHVAVFSPLSVRGIQQSSLRTAELQFRWTAAHQVMADILTREDFLVWSRADFRINQRAS